MSAVNLKARKQAKADLLIVLRTANIDPRQLRDVERQLEAAKARLEEIETGGPRRRRPFWPRLFSERPSFVSESEFFGDTPGHRERREIEQLNAWLAPIYERDAALARLTRVPQLELIQVMQELASSGLRLR